MRRWIHIGAAALLLGLVSSAGAATQLKLTGPQGQGPIAPAPDGRFAFNDVALRRNAVNKFTVTATNAAGDVLTRDISITQLSLDAVVVSRIIAEPLPPERVIQLVNDGVIKLADPENFNVSTFTVVLTIANQPVTVAVPIVFPKGELPTGFEVYKLPRDTGNDGGSKPTPQDTEIIVFDQEVPGPPDVPKPRIPGVLIIQGSIKSLKEFFSVRLLLMNTSGIFTLSQVKANIEFPDAGLSPTLPADGTIAYDDILPGDGDTPGQKEREFIVRGDEIGRKRVRVNFGGFVTGPGIPQDGAIPFNGSAEASVEVKGPPSFRVRLVHPDHVTANVPYDLTVEIANTGDSAALYASLDLDVGADGEFVECAAPANPDDDPACSDIEGPLTRNLKHLFPGDVAKETFLVRPKKSGDITSCIGVSDQNISLEVLVGTIGCLVGKLPAERGDTNGLPTVHVLPFPNALGVGVESPVVAFFSELMDESTITTGADGTFQVFDSSGALLPGKLRFTEVNATTFAIWQVNDGITNRLAGNTEHSVTLTQGIRDLDGNKLFNSWTSTFTTTDPTNDQLPPALTLSIEPGVDAANVLPGQLVRINAYAADQGTGVQRIELRELDTDVADSAFKLIDQKSVFLGDQPPFIFVVDSANLVPGHTYQYKATAFDGAGNSQESTIAVVIAPSADPPTITLPDDPMQDVLHGISIEIVPVALTGGVRKVSYFRDLETSPFATLTVAPYKTTLGTTGLAVGMHSVRAVAEDGLGQTGEDVFQFNLADNPNDPIVNFGSTPNGAQYLTGTRFTVQGGADDPVGIQSLKFYLDSPMGPPLPSDVNVVSIDTAALSIGTHRLFLIATNLVGNSNDPGDPASFIDFSVLDLPNGPPPPAPMFTNVSAPSGNVSQVQGTSVPLARVDLTNVTLNVTVSAFADGGGLWSTGVDANAGDTLRAVAFDFSTSQQPSMGAQTLVPAPPVLDHIEVTPTSFNLDTPNAFQDLTVTGFYVGGSTANLTSLASYSSSAPAVASVSSTGRVVALSSGSATITVSLGGKQATATATVSIVTLTSISTSPSSLTFTFLTQTQGLTVTRHFSDASTVVGNSGATFASSDPAIATVSAAGVVTAKANGSTSIAVSVSGLAPLLVPVEVSANDPAPTIQILSPANGTDVERGDSVNVVVQADDVGSGVASVELEVSGQTTYTETRQIAPAAASTTPSFTFSVANSAIVGGTITLKARAVDVSGGVSTDATRTLDVVDDTAPVVTIVQPLPDTPFNFGDTVNVQIAATDGVGIEQVRFTTSGSFSTSGSKSIVPVATSADETLTFTIPFGLSDPELTIRAYARDAAGNEGASVPVTVQITDADITPPQTIVTAVSNPGSGATTTVTYEITDGAEDLDHVELYFRRNGIGTFNRYTKAVGNADGKFIPQGPAGGTIVFNSTCMGGDGTYEFFTVGVDVAGNREPYPVNGMNMPIADPGATAIFATGAPVTVITTNTNIFDSSLDDKNLRIDGATVTLEGTRTFHNVELLNGAVLTHRKTTASDAYRLDLTVWTLSIDATSRLDVSALGYIGGRDFDEPGRTAGNVYGSARRNGGSFGGLGGHDPEVGIGEQPGPVYGDLTEPLDLGSGGGAHDHTDGGDGGGLALLAATNIAVDGAIRADGGEASNSRAGMGSGGGLNVRTRTLSGKGTIEADGGNKNGADNIAGGGGRIAIRYLDFATYDTARITARAGDGFYADGADGTVFLKQESEANGELVISGTAPNAPFTNLILPPGQTFDGLTLQNNARVIAQGAIDLTGTLRLRGNSVLTHPSADEDGLQITAARVDVEVGSAIDASGRGYIGGRDFDEPGRTLANAYGSGRRNGGSHGGVGAHDPTLGEQPGLVYGDPKHPDHLGGGGGAHDHTDGGDGGGYVRIIASEEVRVDGAVRADGGQAGNSRAGMGAGGSVWITTSKLGGTGFITADGGNKNGGDNIGGGGGRVALYADFIDAGDDFDGLLNVTALRGRGFYDNPPGSAGTVFVQLAGESHGKLIVDDNVIGATSPTSTPLNLIGPGTTTAVMGNTLTTDGFVAIQPNGLVGLRLNPNLNQTETFAIASNAANTITVVSPNENAVSFGSVAAMGARYGGSWRFDDVTLRRGGNLVVGDRMQVNATLALTGFALLTHPETEAHYEAILDLDVATLSIEANSRIDVSGRGYIGGREYEEPGRTLANAYGSGRRNGGSYGGLGAHDPAVGEQPGALYGSLTDPLDLGSGGGAHEHTDGGDGGGRVIIVADTIIDNGVIDANGGQASPSRAGMGSGGSVNLTVNELSGNGFIRADGGNKNGADNVGGGGGRIAIRYATSLTLPQVNIEARAGDGFYADGGHGTVFIKSAAQAHGDLLIDGFGFVQPADSVKIPGGLSFDNITLQNGVRAVADDGLTVTDTLRLAGNSTLTHSPVNEDGLQITAARVEVEAGCAIDVSGRGYLGGRDFEEPGRTLANAYGSGRRNGGSYGGLGAHDPALGEQPGLVYGDPKHPDRLGSGGGAHDHTDGGDGGGYVRIIASDEVRVDGAVRADGGQAGNGRAGMGSGGSVWITTATLGGTGFITADGGNKNGADNIGGGGGRVALYAESIDAMDDFNGLLNVTALRGRGFYDNPAGSAGTVFVQLAGASDGDLIIDDNVLGATSPNSTPLNLIGPGTTAAVMGNTLTGDGFVALLPNGLVGLRLNPNLNQSETFAIASNTATTITVVSPNEHAVSFASVAAMGARYAGLWRFDDVTLRRGGNLVVGDPIHVNDTMALTGSAMLTHPETDTHYEAIFDLDVGTLTIDAASRIDVSGRGYIGGRDFDEAGRTLANAYGSGRRNGGSYGGLGGHDPLLGEQPGPVYGSTTNPLDLGSGGGAHDHTDGGDGGGRVIIAADTIVNDGVIEANGGQASPSRAGMGSGGTVNLTVNELNGSGFIRADGGTKNGADNVGGGGGRVAVRYTTDLTLPQANITAAAGDGFYADGQPGTVSLQELP